MQRRRAVEQHGVLADHLFEDVPDFRLLFLDQLLGGFHRTGETLGVETRVDERLEQFERHLLRQAALVQLEFRTDDDDRTARVVDALAEQVLAEAALLALQHVGQRLQRALVGARDDAATAAVVEQRVHRLLQHPLLVADDDVGSAEFHQTLEAVVTVDHAAIEIVEIRRREAAAIQRHQRTQIRRDHRHDRQDHPLRAAARGDEALDQLETLGDLLRFQLAGGLGQFDAQAVSLGFEVDRLHQLAHGFSADVRRERIFAQRFLLLEVLFLRQQLLFLERGQARLGDDVAFEVEHALHVLQRHVEHQRDARGQRLQEPDVGDGRREFDVAHALAPDAGERHFNAALLAGHAAVLDALVLAAKALVILDRPEDAGAEQAITLRLERAVVDRFRLLDLARRPLADLFGARDRDPDRLESRRRCVGAEQVGDFLAHPEVLPLGVTGGRGPRIFIAKRRSAECVDRLRRSILDRFGFPFLQFDIETE